MQIGFAGKEAFDEWAAVVAGSLTEVSISPTVPGPFHGRMAATSFGEVSVGTVTAGGHELRRTRRHIARADAVHVIGSIVVAGTARVEHGGRRSVLKPGSMIFYDTTQTIAWRSEGDIEDVTIRVERDRVRDVLGIRPDDWPAGLVIADRVGPMIASYFRRVAAMRDANPRAAAMLAGSGINLLGSAASIAAGSEPGKTDMSALLRQQVLDYVRAHFTDPDLTADRVAAGCQVSRRTLYRMVDGIDGGLGGYLRTLRVERAKQILAQGNSVAAAARGSGFASERQFYRTFGELVGVTPGQYRAALAGTNCHEPGTR
ncbi:helix-turn-helix domain-containing protein [Nocardia camponoti]|uniref:AraC family transcriptional regulator n=1 Tax=Nocardia camponoti TaxID=1616106 RepID=A0A917QM01_9NOCA|nr:helix-turn-helix domain-containing protein [Nocardia camponoti]GGK57329.1 AraC family transcriptional regulator [Nocardia camponoti]